MLFIIRVFLTMTLISLFSSPVFADETFSLKAGYLRLDTSGEIAGSATGVAGTVIDLDDDLDIEEDDGYIVEAALQFGSFRLFAAYLPLKFSGDSLLTRDIAFNGETFVAGSRVESDVKIDIYEAGLAWFLVNIDDLPVRIQFGPEMSVKYIDASIELQDDTFDLNESEDSGVPVPSLGARARVSIADYLSMVSRVGYLKYDGNSLMDVDVQAEFSPTPLVGLFAGYRYLDIDVDSNDLLIDATFSGPYAGAMVRF
jgi:hypothetical protein